jgi:hypothetical protein
MSARVHVGNTPLLGGNASLTPHLVEGNAFAPELVALRKEALTGISLGKKGLVFFAQFVPKIVEIMVVGPPNDMR